MSESELRAILDALRAQMIAMETRLEGRLDRMEAARREARVENQKAIRVVASENQRNLANVEASVVRHRKLQSETLIEIKTQIAEQEARWEHHRDQIREQITQMSIADAREAGANAAKAGMRKSFVGAAVAVAAVSGSIATVLSLIFSSH